MANQRVPAAGEALPAGKAVPDQIWTTEKALDAYRDLEHDICSIRSMAKILGDMLDDHLVDFDTKAQTGALINIRLTDHEMDMMSFAWNDVIYRAGRLVDAFYAASEGKAIQ